MSSNFRIPHLFVVPTGNTLPTTGNTAALTANQFGIFRTDYTVATAGNAAAAAPAGLFLAQGKGAEMPIWMPTKKSGVIKSANVVEWYKVPARTGSSVQISNISDLELQCDEFIHVTLRLESNLVSNAYFNGLTRTITVQAPCCECGEDPCASITDDQYDDFYAAVAAAINADKQINPFIVATVTGTQAGGNAMVVLTGKALTNPFPTSSDVHNDPFRFDALRFHTFVSNAPQTSQDYEVVDRCDIPGVVTTTQRATYPTGSAREVRQMEIDTFSYHMPAFKQLFSDADYNGPFASHVDAAFYDMYYIDFREAVNHFFNENVPMASRVIVAIPTGAAAGIEAILTAAYGTPANKASTGAVSFSPMVP